MDPTPKFKLTGNPPEEDEPLSQSPVDATEVAVQSEATVQPDERRAQAVEKMRRDNEWRAEEKAYDATAIDDVSAEQPPPKQEPTKQQTDAKEKREANVQARAKAKQDERRGVEEESKQPAVHRNAPGQYDVVDGQIVEEPPLTKEEQATLAQPQRAEYQDDPAATREQNRQRKRQFDSNPPPPVTPARPAVDAQAAQQQQANLPDKINEIAATLAVMAESIKALEVKLDNIPEKVAILLPNKSVATFS